MKMLAQPGCLVWMFVLAGCGSAKPLDPPVVAVTAQGAAAGDVVTKSVGTAGGALASADGRLTVEVPAGALAADASLTVQPIQNLSPGGNGLAYRLGPEGQTFLSPVKLTFKFNPADLMNTQSAALGIAYQDSQGRWASLKALTLDETAGTLSAQTTHFSDWSMVRGWQLDPGKTSVRSGGTVNLVVTVCAMQESGDAEVVDLRYACRPDPDFFTPLEWSVNGIVHGDGTVGRVAVSGDNAAEYAAPDVAPAANPVAVSVSTANRKTGAKTLLTSNIWVDAYPPLTGMIQSTDETSDGDSTNTLTTNVTVSFRYDSQEQAYKLASGTADLRWDIVSVSGACASHTGYNGALGAGEGTIAVFPDGSYYPAGNTPSVTFDGTTTCNSTKKPEPLSVPGGANWWPNPTQMPFLIKADGTLSESITDSQNGRTTKVSWSLSP